MDFKAQPLSPGGDVTFSTTYAGKPAFIYAWATWCGPCRQIAPYIDQLKAKYDGKGISFIAIALDSPSAVREFERKTPHQLDVLIDPESSIGRTLDTSSIPTLCVVDSEHRIVTVQQGMPSDNFAMISQALDAVAKS